MKKFLIIFVLIFLTLTLSSCQNEKSSTGIKSIETEDLTEEKFYCGTISKDEEIKVKGGKNFDVNDIKVVIEDDSVININFKFEKKRFFTNYLSFEITCLKEGTTSFFFETQDKIIKSEPIEINILKNIKSLHFENQEDLTLYKGEVRHDNNFIIESYEEVTLPKNLVECISENEQIITVEYDESYNPNSLKINCFRVGETYIYLQTKDKSVKSEKVKIIVREPTPQDIYDKGKIVYVTPHGKKYHYDKNCAGKNTTETTENLAIPNYEPCKRCTR